VTAFNSGVDPFSAVSAAIGVQGRPAAFGVSAAMGPFRVQDENFS